MGQISIGSARVRSLLTIDPLDLSTADTSASADALILDLAKPLSSKGARPKQAAGAVVFLNRVRARAYHPLLFVRFAPLEAERADDDLDAVMPGRPDGIVLTGCPDGAAVQQLGSKLAVREASLGFPDGSTAIVADTGAAGLVALRDFRGASPRLAALTWDAAALAASCGAPPGAFDDDVAPTVVRTLLAIAAAAAGIPAYDGVTAAQGDAFARECATAKRLGFAGKIARDAGQVAVINVVFGGAAARAAAGRAQPT